MLKIISLLISIIVIVNSKSFAQSKESRFLIDTCITILKKNSVNTGKVDWDIIQKTAYAKADKINDPAQLGDVMRFLMQSLNDFHGTIFYKDSMFKWTRNEPPLSDSIMNEWKKGVKIHPVILEGNIGYMRVPFIPYRGKEDADKRAQQLNDSLCYLLKKDVKGMVIDLRLNGGGAMFPMMLGMEQLLGEGKIGEFTNGGEKWFIKDHNFLLDTAVLTTIQPSCSLEKTNFPVVVLIGKGTGSSGEFLTMAFKGRPNTYFVGNETAGYITAVAGFPVNDSAFINLSIGYGIDKKGNIYSTAILPDKTIESPDSFNDLSKDEKVRFAVEWIRQH
jgi:C-terminal processing protease CtpA/Prc